MWDLLKNKNHINAQLKASFPKKLTWFIFKTNRLEGDSDLKYSNWC